MLILDPLPGQQQAETIIGSAVNDKALLALLVVALIAVVFYILYLRYHRPEIRRDMDTKQAIAEAQASTTANLNSTAATQREMASDLSSTAKSLSEHFEAVKQFKGCQVPGVPK